MNKMIIKQIISWLLVLIWLIIIFMFSETPAYESNNASQQTFSKVVETTLENTNNLGITNKHPTENKINQFVLEYNSLFRKITHIFIYFILSLLILNALRLYSLKPKIFLICFFLCFLLELFDEYHQTFVIGRTGQIKDVLIDLIGSTLGILFYYLIFKVFIKKRKMTK